MQCNANAVMRLTQIYSYLAICLASCLSKWRRIRQTRHPSDQQISRSISMLGDHLPTYIRYQIT